MSNTDTILFQPDIEGNLSVNGYMMQKLSEKTDVDSSQVNNMIKGLRQLDSVSNVKK